MFSRLFMPKVLCSFGIFSIACFLKRIESWFDASSLSLEDQVIFGQGFFPLDLAKIMTNDKAVISLPKTGTLTRYYQPGQLNPDIF